MGVKVHFLLSSPKGQVDQPCWRLPGEQHSFSTTPSAAMQDSGPQVACGFVRVPKRVGVVLIQRSRVVTHRQDKGEEFFEAAVDTTLYSFISDAARLSIRGSFNEDGANNTGFCFSKKTRVQQSPDGFSCVIRLQHFSSGCKHQILSALIFPSDALRPEPALR